MAGSATGSGQKRRGLILMNFIRLQVNNGQMILSQTLEAAEIFITNGMASAEGGAEAVLAIAWQAHFDAQVAKDTCSMILVSLSTASHHRLAYPPAKLAVVTVARIGKYYSWGRIRHGQGPQLIQGDLGFGLEGNLLRNSRPCPAFAIHDPFLGY